MSEYTEFTYGDKSAKAYHHIKGLKKIESSGINLNNVFSGISQAIMPSVTESENILYNALWSDIENMKERREFVDGFFAAHGAFRASDLVLAFVLDAMKMPKVEDDGDGEKKT